MSEQQKAVAKAELKHLIIQAAKGDDSAARRLISPFIHPEEKLLHYGISASFGLIRTYDFLFLTDRRIGDLEITPLTGALNVEVAYVQKIDAFVLTQPAFPLLLRLLMLALYPFCTIGAFLLCVSPGFGVISILCGALLAVLSVLLVLFAVNPALKRAFLRFKKSGLWCKLQGNPVGVLIFADRDKFGMLTTVTRHLTEVKRQLDKVAM